MEDKEERTAREERASSEERVSGEDKVSTGRNGDFASGSVARHMLRLAGPMTVAQLINVLYNVVDRVYIGRIPGQASLALTGLGVCFPMITIVIAFANLAGSGGAPLFSIERGKGNHREAEYLLGNCVTLLVVFGLVLMALGLLFKRPLLYLLGASGETYPYADAYITIYLLGSVFVTLSLGLNTFINAQGFSRTGMLTVAIGAVINLILDPVFIFVFHMGVQGAALATILSQMVAAAWTLRFLTGRKTYVRIRRDRLRCSAARVRRIAGLGLAGFTMSVTNSAVQMVCNATLQTWGGDLYVGVMTVISSIREVVQSAIMGISNSAQPVMSYNYGAGRPERVRQAIRYTTWMQLVSTFLMWAVLSAFPVFFIHIFNDDAALTAAGVPCMHIYFFGFFMMTFQFAGQSVFTALGMSRRAVFFSILRKGIIVIPLTLALPWVCGLGVKGVFLAEPISNFVGGAACFLTMYGTVYRRLEAGGQAAR